MSSSTIFIISTNVTLETEECYKCGVTFAMPKDLRRKFLRNRNESFYCPNGHSQHYIGETKEARLERELLAMQQSRDSARNARDDAQQEAEHFRKSRDGIKGVLVRTQKRIANACCPCCNRHFPNDKLAKHIAVKHPTYAQEPEIEK